MQLQELRGNQAPDDKEAVARRLAAAEAAARSAAETEAGQKAEEEARKKAERGSAPATEIEAKQRAEGSVAPATIGMKLPIMGAGEPAPAAPAPGMPQEAVPTAKEEIDPLEDLLPKPALDFSRAPKHVDPNDPFNIYRPERKGVGKQELVVGAVVLAVVLVAGVGAWYKNRISCRFCIGRRRKMLR